MDFAERYDQSRRNRISRFKPIVLVLAPLLAILFQLYVPRFATFFGMLNLPLLVVVYFSLMRRMPVLGILFGASVGLVQDSLSSQPLGVLGIVQTLVGYFAASMSLRVDGENPAVRLFVGFFFFLFHQFFYWLLVRALLGAVIPVELVDNLVMAVLNCAVGLPLFALFDRLKMK